MTTTTIPQLATMPTEEDLERAIHIVTDDLADVMVNIRHRVTKIAKWQGKEAPTLEDIGRLYVFLRTFEDDYREIEGCLRDIRESLFELDHVRIQENVNPVDGITVA